MQAFTALIKNDVAVHSGYAAGKSGGRTAASVTLDEFMNEVARAIAGVVGGAVTEGRLRTGE